MSSHSSRPHPMLRNLLIPSLLLVPLLLLTACGDRVQQPDGDGQTVIELELLAGNLTAPLTLKEPPGGGGQRFVVDQAGVIRVITPEGELLNDPFLDLRGSIVDLNEAYDERGLLGLAFHPEYQQNGRFYVYYSAPLRAEAPQDWDHTSRLSSFTVSDDPTVADPASEQILMQVDQPQVNHNGGTLDFGPDGYLYVSLGDGGGADDTGTGHVSDWYDENEGGNGQDVTDNLLGSILRIDVDGGSPYGIPPDNPFVGGEGMDEIYAWGLRNPFGFSFDHEGTGDLIAADAGQVRWEEVNVIQSGGNYGWNVKEGTECFNAADNTQPLDDCPDTDPDGNELIDPVIEFRNSSANNDGDGLVVTSGHIYQGEDLPSLSGMYLFGTWSQRQDAADGALFVADPAGSGMWEFSEAEVRIDGSTGLAHYLLGIGRDNSGELYVLTTDNAGPAGSSGNVYRVTGYTPGN